MRQRLSNFWTVSTFWTASTFAKMNAEDMLIGSRKFPFGQNWPFWADLLVLLEAPNLKFFPTLTIFDGKPLQEPNS
jgi:hypothetical protein